VHIFTGKQAGKRAREKRSFGMFL